MITAAIRTIITALPPNAMPMMRFRLNLSAISPPTMLPVAPMADETSSTRPTSVMDTPS